MAELYPGNSNKAKESSLIREPIETHPSQDAPADNHPRIVQQKPVKRHISPVREVFAAIFPGGVEELKEHLLWDIFVPWAQDMLRSGWQGLGDVIFPGSKRGTTSQERYSYNAPYTGVTYSQNHPYEETNYNDMHPMRTREEVEDVLRNLRDIRKRYGVVTLLDFNDCVGNPTRPTQNNYGWVSLESAMIVRANGGWVLKMPRAVPIDDFR